MVEKLEFATGGHCRNQVPNYLSTWLWQQYPRVRTISAALFPDSLSTTERVPFSHITYTYLLRLEVHSARAIHHTFTNYTVWILIGCDL